jgi:Uncharacterized protein conserved in bacteria (DUF2252)
MTWRAARATVKGAGAGDRVSGGSGLVRGNDDVGNNPAGHGHRVVAGQHLMQAQSDIFIGWTRVPGPDKVDRDLYVRQLKDWKFSAPIERALPRT